MYEYISQQPTKNVWKLRQNNRFDELINENWWKWDACMEKNKRYVLINGFDTQRPTQHVWELRNLYGKDSLIQFDEFTSDKNIKWMIKNERNN